MASKAKIGGCVDVHNEYTPVKRITKKNKKVWDRKCNHCNAIMCRNISVLVNHTNNNCPGCFMHVLLYPP